MNSAASRAGSIASCGRKLGLVASFPAAGAMSLNVEVANESHIRYTASAVSCRYHTLRYVLYHTGSDKLCGRSSVAQTHVPTNGWSCNVIGNLTRGSC